MMRNGVYSPPLTGGEHKGRGHYIIFIIYLELGTWNSSRRLKERGGW